MATTLKALLQFANLAPGASATLAHGINVSGVAFRPDAVAFANPLFDLAGYTATTLTVVNRGSTTASCDVLCEWWHTYERAFPGGASQLNLAAAPFVTRGSISGGASFEADRIFTKRWAYGTAAIVYYVRPAGNDSNDGLTPATAFATLERALHFMAISDLNLPTIVDITGMTVSGNTVLNLGGNVLGGLSADLDLTATAPDNFFSKAGRQIRSEPTLVQAVNVTGSAFAATTGLLTLTVSDALVANALRGKTAVGSLLGEYGAVISNTGGPGPNTIVVANVVGLTNPVNIYGPGATLRFGDAANFFDQAIYLNALSDWNLQWLTLDSNGPKDAAISIWAAGTVSLTACDVKGLAVSASKGKVLVDGCYVHDATFAQDGAAIVAQQSYFRSLVMRCHGSGGSGINEWIGVGLGACEAFGGGNVESEYSFYLANALVDGGTGHGVSVRFGTSRVQNTIIQNCVGSGVEATGTCMAVLDNVQGAANGGYGVIGSYGAQVKRVNASAITGALGDTKPGAVAVTAWGATPVTDPNQLVRIGA